MDIPFWKVPSVPADMWSEELLIISLSTSGSIPLNLLITDVTLQFLDMFGFAEVLNLGMKL